jgi:uncharacterized protein YegL
MFLPPGKDFVTIRRYLPSDKPGFAMFITESPENYEQKCHCILILDVSSSMAGSPMEQLNQGLAAFHREVMQDYAAAQRLEISIVTFGSAVQVAQEPALVGNFAMPRLTANGSTRLVDGVRKAISLDDERKRWYRQTGQNYYRSLLVLITDGEPDADQDLAGLGATVREGVSGRRFTFYGLGVRGYNAEKLARICPANMPPLPLDGYKFAEFFKWLSNSISLITTSREGDTVNLPPVSGWTQMQM